MDISKFKNQSSAQIINRKEVEVTAPDGEVFTVLCQIGSYINEETRKQELFWLETLFDKNFSDNKEQMINNIWRESLHFGIGGGILGISSGTRYEDRARIGNRIKEIREERGIEARDLARLVGIVPWNMKIEWSSIMLFPRAVYWYISTKLMIVRRIVSVLIVDAECSNVAVISVPGTLHMTIGMKMRLIRIVLMNPISMPLQS